MHLRRLCAALLALLVAPASASTWTFRGTLEDGNAPAQGTYGFRLRFYDAASGGRELAGPVELGAVSVERGGYSAEVQLPEALASRGSAWLAIEVLDTAGTPVPLPERQLVELATAESGVCWDLTGNAGTTAGTNFVGTTDNQPLVFKTKDQEVGRLLIADPLNNATSVIFGRDNLLTSSINGQGVATISGGRNNSAGALYSVIAGGLGNEVSSNYGTIGGGQDNTVAGEGASLSGGYANTATGSYATVPGGNENLAGGDFSYAAGKNAVVRSKLNDANGTNEPACSVGTCGDEGSFVWSDSTSTALAPYRSTGPNQFMVKAVGGFAINTEPNTSVGAPGAQAAFTVGGLNTSRGTAMFFSPKGPNASHIHFGSQGDWYMRSSTASGKLVLQDTGGNVAIGTGDPASFRLRVVGSLNTASFETSAEAGTAVLGRSFSDTGPGGTGVFGWSSGLGAGVYALNDAGGVTLFLEKSGTTVDGRIIGTSAGASLTNGGVWTNASDRNLKEDFEALDAEWVLARLEELPVASWRYKVEPDAVRHVGPTAQDFRAAFGLGDDERSIGTVDGIGVALAAIKGLDRRQALARAEWDETQQALVRENAALRRANEELSARLSAIENAIGLGRAASVAADGAPQ
jgi:hypothetical protein